MNFFAVIPVKYISERVKSKNFRKFYNNKSLLDILLDKLIKIKSISKIYISTDNEKLKLNNQYTKKRIEIIKRDKKYCNNKTPWSDVIHNVVSNIPINNNDNLMWCHTTTPLFDDYEIALRQYKKNTKYNGLVAVSKINEFLIGENKIPLNYSWGNWHKYSQDMPNTYAISGALFISKKREFLRNRYVISTKPDFYVASSFSSLDIDNSYDFELAKYLYKNKKKFLKIKN